MTIPQWLVEYFGLGAKKKQTDSDINLAVSVAKDTPESCCENPDLVTAASKHPIDIFEEYAEEHDLQILDFCTYNELLHITHEDTHSFILSEFYIKQLLFYIKQGEDIIEMYIPVEYNIEYTDSQTVGFCIYEDQIRVSTHKILWEKQACLNCLKCQGWDINITGIYKRSILLEFYPHLETYDTMCQVSYENAIATLKTKKDREDNERKLREKELLEKREAERLKQQRFEKAMEICKIK